MMQNMKEGEVLFSEPETPPVTRPTDTMNAVTKSASVASGPEKMEPPSLVVDVIVEEPADIEALLQSTERDLLALCRCKGALEADRQQLRSQFASTEAELEAASDMTNVVTQQLVRLERVLDVIESAVPKILRARNELLKVHASSKRDVLGGEEPVPKKRKSCVCVATTIIVGAGLLGVHYLSSGQLL